MMELIDYIDMESSLGPRGNVAAMVTVKLPFKMYLSWDRAAMVRSVLVNAHIADALKKALNEIHVHYGEPLIRQYGLDEWGGSYNNRLTRGSTSKWSTHSWGMAVDYLPSMGGYGLPPITPYFVVEAFERQGFAWGGYYDYPDGMHFTGVRE